MAETIIVELGTKHFQEANAAVRAALAEADTVCIVEAYAQRYLGCLLYTSYFIPSTLRAIADEIVAEKSLATHQYERQTSQMIMIKVT